MKADWVTKIADRVEANVRQRKGEQATIVCASGISPIGPNSSGQSTRGYDCTPGSGRTA